MALVADTALNHHSLTHSFYLSFGFPWSECSHEEPPLRYGYYDPYCGCGVGRRDFPVDKCGLLMIFELFLDEDI